VITIIFNGNDAAVSALPSFIHIRTRAVWIIHYFFYCITIKSHSHREISGTRGGQYEGDCLLFCCAL
jgi:hypothetical protein